MTGGIGLGEFRGKPLAEILRFFITETGQAVSLCLTMMKSFMDTSEASIISFMFLNCNCLRIQAVEGSEWRPRCLSPVLGS